MKRPTTRSFPIKTVTTLSLFAAAPGCSDKDSDGGGGSGITGDWALTAISGDYGTYSYPYTAAGTTKYGYSYSYTVGIQLRADSDTTADWCVYYTMTYDGATYDGEYCEYDVTMSRSGSSYDIQVGSTFTMTCDPGRSTMSCDAILDGASYAMDFDRL